MACGSTRAEQTDDPDAVHKSDVPTEDDILYRAIVDVFAEHDVPVEIASEEKQIVVGPWEELNSEVRRRLVARVVRAHAGLILRVRAEYQRMNRAGPAPTWEPADDPLTARKAHREEQRLGQAIQARFRDLQRR